MEHVMGDIGIIHFMQQLGYPEQCHNHFVRSSCLTLDNFEVAILYFFKCLESPEMARKLNTPF